MCNIQQFVWRVERIARFSVSIWRNIYTQKLTTPPPPPPPHSTPYIKHLPAPLYIFKKNMYRPENARYARLPVQPWLILILDVAVFRRLSTHSWVKHAQTHRAHKHFSLLSMSLFASLSAVFDLPIAGTFLLASCFFFLKEHLHFHITFAFYLVFLSLSFKFLSLINSIWFCTEIPEI